MKMQDVLLREPPRTNHSSRHTKAPRLEGREHDLRAGDGVATSVPVPGVPFHRTEPKGPRTSRRPEKAAGADLKAQYRTTVLVGFVLSLALLVALTYIDFHFDGGQETFVFEQQEIVEMQEIQQTQQIERVPLPPRPSAPVEVPNDQVIEDEPIDFDASLDLNVALDVPTAPPPPPLEEESEVTDDSDEIFVVVEERPELIGGMQAIYDEIKYPAVMRQAGVQGRVIVQFVVDENGDVVDPVVLQSPHSMLSNEALRVMQLVKFTPGRQRSQAVKVQMALPVIFQLEDTATNW